MLDPDDRPKNFTVLGYCRNPDEVAKIQIPLLTTNFQT